MAHTLARLIVITINQCRHQGQALNLWPWRQEFLFFMEQSPDPAGAWERAELYCGCSPLQHVCWCLGSGVQAHHRGLSSPLVGQPLSLCLFQPVLGNTSSRGEPGLQPPTAHRSPSSQLRMPATELINAGVGKCWVIVQSLFKRSMGNLAVALQICDVHTGIVPPRTVRDLHVSAYNIVEMHTGAQALMHTVVSMLVGECSLCPCPDLTWWCWAWLQANLLMLSFHPDPCRSLGSEVLCVLRRLIQHSGWIFPSMQMV